MADAEIDVEVLVDDETSSVPTLAAHARRAAARYRATVGMHRGLDPRRQVVERRVPHGVAELATVLEGHRPIRFRGGTLTLDAGAVGFDPVNRELFRAAHLRLRWSWPALPVRVAVGELRSDLRVVRLSLRSRRRARYPARFFHAAHTALATMTS